MSRIPIPVVRSNRSTPDKAVGSSSVETELHLALIQCTSLRDIAYKWEAELNQLREFSHQEKIVNLSYENSHNKVCQ